MGFKKGDVRINRQGRPKGKPNLITRDLRDLLQNFCNRKYEDIERDWKELTPRERVQTWIGLLPYVTPRLQSVEQKSDLDRLSDEQLEILANKLISKL